jgi:hypothetical protein
VPVMRLRAPFAIVVGAVALRLAIGVGFANYDTLYSLAWGQQLARGQTPATNCRWRRRRTRCSKRSARSSSRSARPRRSRSSSRSPTSRSLRSATSSTGSAPTGFHGLSAWPRAALILSRYEVLSYGVRAYADIPYVVLVLGALALETRRRRAGWPVIALLDLAGLLRPEAWLFAAVYWLYLWRGSSPRGAWRSSPRCRGWRRCCGRSRDLAVTGNALWSLTNTRSTARELGRATGLAQRPLLRRAAARRGARPRRPRRRGDRRRAGAVADPPAGALGAAAVLIAVVALAARRDLRAADPGPLRVPDRGARRGVRRRRPVRLALAASPSDRAGGCGRGRGRDRRRDRRLDRLAGPALQQDLQLLKPADQSLDAQQRIASDLVALTSEARSRPSCLPISVPYATPVPLLALYLHTSPANVVAAVEPRHLHRRGEQRRLRPVPARQATTRSASGGVPAAFAALPRTAHGTSTQR